MADEVVQPKPIYASKTFWFNILMIVAMLVPKSQQFIVDYFGPQGAMVGFGLINVVLRLVSKGKVELW